MVIDLLVWPGAASTFPRGVSAGPVALRDGFAQIDEHMLLCWKTRPGSWFSPQIQKNFKRNRVSHSLTTPRHPNIYLLKFGDLSFKYVFGIGKYLLTRWLSKPRVFSLQESWIFPGFGTFYLKISSVFVGDKKLMVPQMLETPFKLRWSRNSTHWWCRYACVKRGPGALASMMRALIGKEYFWLPCVEPQPGC